MRRRGFDAGGKPRKHLLEPLALGLEKRVVRVGGSREMRVGSDDLRFGLIGSGSVCSVVEPQAGRFIPVSILR
jgi:hypothetical protein